MVARTGNVVLLPQGTLAEAYSTPAMPASDSATTEHDPALAHSPRFVVWSSFLLALLQSICGAVVALSGLRLAIGLGSLALSATTTARLIRYHGDAIRIPMLAVALLGSLFTLGVLFHVRRLRQRPSSQWRLQPLSSAQTRMNRLQVILSVTTLVLIAIEEYLHLQFHHTL